jgi:hypothetical protein
LRESQVHTDESQLYNDVADTFFAHETVKHTAKEYVRYWNDVTDELRPDGKPVVKTTVITTNTIEGYFSIFKRGMKVVYQHCKEKHLHRYLAEYDFRYNHRIALNYNDGDRATLAVKNAAGKASHVSGDSLSDFSKQARRFLRWRSKQPKPKPRFVKYWRTR